LFDKFNVVIVLPASCNKPARARCDMPYWISGPYVGKLNGGYP